MNIPYLFLVICSLALQIHCYYAKINTIVFIYIIKFSVFMICSLYRLNLSLPMTIEV